jgi:repressor LexA
MVQPLTPRQEAILSYIAGQIARQGYAPSVREIGAAVGISSSSTVHKELKRLENLALLRRDPAKPRAMVVQAPAAKIRGFSGRLGANPLGEAFPGHSEASEGPFLPPVYDALPVRTLDTLDQDDQPAAAQPWLAPQGAFGAGEYFLAEMPDDSLINRQIYPGDLLVLRRQPAAGAGGSQAGIQNGDVVVLRLAGRVLLRTYYKGLRQIRLQSENDQLEPLMAAPEEIRVIAKLAGIIRRFR